MNIAKPEKIVVFGLKPVRIPARLVLSPTSRWPTRLPEPTVKAVMELPVPAAPFPAQPNKPKYSVIIATFNGLFFTRLCLTSLLLNTKYPRYEVIVVDNGSTDGTLEYLHEVAALNSHVRVVSNGTNRGFAAGNNQGLALARGEILVLLNNDTIISAGWLRGLTRALDDPSVGLAGPVTNRTCNESQIETSYWTYEEFLIFANEIAKQQSGVTLEMRTLAFFCVAMRREAFQRLGPLDEQFGLGSFEDGDYCMRARHAGYRLVCAEESFVHHFGQGTLGELSRTGDYEALYQANKRYFEEKWGEWAPQKKRITPDYERVRARVLEVGAERLPLEAAVLVVSKGDEELLRVEGRRVSHFPQSEDGSYPYFYPANSAAAILHLKALKAGGATHLLLPKPALWWREYYPDFAAYLGTPIIVDASCLIFLLNHD